MAVADFHCVAHLQRMACEGLGNTSCADNADVHGDILLLRTCSYNEPGLPRQASETTGHSKPFRVFLTIPVHAMLGMSGIISSTGLFQVRCVSLDVAMILCI